MQDEHTFLSPSYGLLLHVHQPPQLVRHDFHKIFRFLAMLSPSWNNPTQLSGAQINQSEIICAIPSPLTLWETLQGALLSA